MTVTGITRTSASDAQARRSAFADLVSPVDCNRLGVEMYALAAELYPVCRSITGDGVRHTLSRLQREIPLELREIPTGTKVFDWTVPREWNIRDAYIANSRGERVIDFSKHNLHVVSYSVPVHGRLTLAELRPHLFTLPDHPDWIPYRTSYYTENWGFCLSHTDLQALPEAEYEVCIDSTLEPGHLTYGELLIPGASSDEVLISCHCCHPSLANDNLSGTALATFLAKSLSQATLRYSYRFLFIPGTIGSITWLSLNESRASAIKHGLVLTCIGDKGAFTYKKTRRGDTELDSAVTHVLKHFGDHHAIVDFSPYGYDERQYCSPGFNLAVGCLMRTPHGQFPEYHTSADNLDLLSPASLGESLAICLKVLEVLESNKTFLSRNPKCEPQLGKRGLYGAMGGTNIKLTEMAMLWVMNLSDGNANLLQIAERSGMEFSVISRAADLLRKHRLLEELQQA